MCRLDPGQPSSQPPIGMIQLGPQNNESRIIYHSEKCNCGRSSDGNDQTIRGHDDGHSGGGVFDAAAPDPFDIAGHGDFLKRISGDKHKVGPQARGDVSSVG